MTAPSPSAGQAPASSTARLLIHTDPGGPQRRRGAWRRELAWLHRQRPPHTARPGRPALQLRISDLHGQLFMSTDDSPPLLEATLPPGTYHVTAVQGPMRRSYTVTLLDGSTIELYLRLPAPPA